MSLPRIHCALRLSPGAVVDLPPGAARHVQVLRLQPGDAIALFGDPTLGGEHRATVQHMGRSEVRVAVGEHHAIEREAARAVHLVLGMPANDRMDWLVEKATELGVASLQPVVTERSVLRLSGERAQKKRDHWQAVAVAACEQSGRNRVPTVHPVRALADWLAASAADKATPALSGPRWLLSLRPDALPLRAAGDAVAGPVTFLSGPEGGLSPGEEAAALAAGFVPVTLGPRVLRAETAPLAALAVLTV